MMEMIGLSAALLTSFGFLPQILKIHRTKSVASLSVITLLQFTAGVSLWLVYGLLRHDLILVIANSITLVILFIGCALYLKHK